MKRSLFYEKYGKRIIDLTMAIMALTILSPLLVFLAILVKKKLGSPILFKQNRPGMECKIFTIYKFRTMTETKDERGNFLSDHQRITDFGRWLRETSLDELPELVNIIKGEMSFVGPRPQLIKDMMFFTAKEMERQKVLPGLTGWAQINGRNHIGWEEKLKLDLEYIENINIKKDLQILYWTIFRVIKKQDITAEGMDTAEDLGDYLLRIGKIQRDEYQEKMKKLMN